MKTETLVLVCEGQCNRGDVQRFDAAVAREGKKGIQWDMVRLARTFVHTVHQHLRANWFKCGVCGTERKSGTV